LSKRCFGNIRLHAVSLVPKCEEVVCDNAARARVVCDRVVCVKEFCVTKLRVRVTQVVEEEEEEKAAGCRGKTRT
jgi:hypothetical protein